MQTRLVEVFKIYELKTLQALLDTNEVSLETKTDEPSLLYALCQNRFENRQEIIAWLKKGERYLQLGDNIQLNHINAVANEPFVNDDNYHGGLAARHYAALVDNKYLDITVMPNETFQQGPFDDLSFIWVLAENKRFDLIKNWQKSHLNEKVDLNDGPTKRESLALLLAGSNQWQLLEKWHDESNPVSLDSKNLSGQGLAVLLADDNQWQLLEKFYDANSHINLDNETTDEVSVAWLLANSCQWKLLEKFNPENNPLDLNSGNEGMTCSVAFQLAEQNKWQLFERYYRLGDYIDLNTANWDEKNSLHLIQLLILNKKWTLLSNILEAYSQQDIDDLTYNKEDVEILVVHDQWQLIKNITVNGCYLSNNIKDNLEQRINKMAECLNALNQQKIAQDLTNLIQSEYYHRQLTLCQLENCAITEILISIIKNANLVSASSPYYQPMQQILANLLSDPKVVNIISQPDFDMSLLPLPCLFNDMSQLNAQDKLELALLCARLSAGETNAEMKKLILEARVTELSAKAVNQLDLLTVKKQKTDKGSVSMFQPTSAQPTDDVVDKNANGKRRNSLP